ncbi:MAG: heavy-metal-associated domain-containing protein [Candidatus Aminicenantes bacterium]|nr:heavy-metal-associated domain-containing protein [Candidatus Aminicenantes bacterium]
MKKTFRVPDMSCAHCEARIRSALEAAGGITDIHIDLEKKQVSLECVRSSAEILDLLEATGYPATNIGDPE